MVRERTGHHPDMPRPKNEVAGTSSPWLWQDLGISENRVVALVILLFSKELFFFLLTEHIPVASFNSNLRNL